MAKVEFKPGDIVRLVTGEGPRMVVVAASSSAAGHYWCWYATKSNDVVQKELPAPILVKDDSAAAEGRRP